MTSPPSPTGDLSLGHILESAGLDLSQVVILRHTPDLTPEQILAYTRGQPHGNKLGNLPPPLWLVFMKDGGRRSRFVMAYDNHGEVEAEVNATERFFDLRESTALSSLKNRLVIEWGKDTVNWAKTGAVAANFPVVEIADPEKVPFPGFDSVLVSHAQLRDVIEDRRYEAWRVALEAVQGVYLIADTSTGKLYVGKADGRERIFGRWSQYAKDGHGGNKALKTLAGLSSSHAERFQYSLLRVFGPSVPSAEVDAAESHYKRALLSRKPFGLNHN